MFNKQNTLPYNYVMKVASSLVRENISTATEAIDHFKSFKTRYSSAKKETPKVVESPKEEIEEIPVVKTVTRRVETVKKEEPKIDEAVEFEKLKRARKERKKNATVEV